MFFDGSEIILILQLFIPEISVIRATYHKYINILNKKMIFRFFYILLNFFFIIGFGIALASLFISN